MLTPKIFLGLVGLTAGSVFFANSYNKKDLTITRYEEKRRSRGSGLWNTKRTSKGRI